MPHLRTDLSGFERLRQRFPAAVARSLNRAAASACTAMVRVISQDTGIKQADLRGTTARNRRIWTREARPGDQGVVVYASASPIPLIDFGARGPDPSRGKGRGVTARIAGARRVFKHAFFATMESGHRGVFERSGEPHAAVRRRSRGRTMVRPQLPIREMTGISIARAWERNAAVGEARAKEQLVKELAHEVSRLLGGA